MENLSDSQLWELSVKYGTQARLWRQKFLGLLPEIAKRELWKVHGFESIKVFAFKIGGVTENQLQTVLNLEKKYESVPALHNLLVNGEVSVNKLSRIASIADVDNQDFLANQAKLLSRTSLDTLVKDLKHAQENSLASQRSTLEQENIFAQDGLRLDQDVKRRLEELQDKGIDINELLRNMLDKREEKMRQEKEDAASQLPEKSSRYIPRRIKKIIEQEFGSKCAIPNCKHTSKEIHHTDRYSLAGQHNPFFMAPLCKEHHQIAHSIDVKAQHRRRHRSE